MTLQKELSSSFPQETVDIAKQIAKLYHARFTSSFKKITALYAGTFIELNYGFEDAVKQGKTGLYLHEIKQSAECFSLAGVDYVIAKELGLQPRIYQATDMKDVMYGELASNKSSADHAFITVQFNKGEWIIDRSFRLAAKITKVHPDHFEIDVSENRTGTLPGRREFTNIEQLTEDEYVKEMQRYRTGDAGKFALSAGQVLRYKSDKTLVEYISETNTLQSGIHQKVPSLNTKSFSNHKIILLNSPVETDGSFNLDKASFRGFHARNTRWRIAESEDKHVDITFPYALVKEIFSHIDDALKFTGRKSPLYPKGISFASAYFRKKGFDEEGTILFNNGIKKQEYDSLLRELESYFPTFEPAFFTSELAKRVSYHAKTRNKQENKYFSKLYFEEDQIMDFVQKNVNKLRKKSSEEYSLLFDRHLAKAKLKPNLNNYNKQLKLFESEKSFIIKFESFLTYRGESRSYFDEVVDYYMYSQTETNFSFTQEDLKNFYKVRSFDSIATGKIYKNYLEQKSYRSGLKQLLRSD